MVLLGLARFEKKTCSLFQERLLSYAVVTLPYVHPRDEVEIGCETTGLAFFENPF